MPDPLLRALVDLRDRQIQKARIQFGNRLNALERDVDDDPGGHQAIILMRYLDRFQDLEAELDQDIAELIDGFPICDQLQALKGIGPGLAAKLVAMIDIERAPTVSALWRYAGYAVIDGEREKPVKGEKLHYNKRLKTTCYLVGSSFLKASSPYREIYDTAKERYERDRPEWTKLHRHRAAMRKMIKLFLAHFWQRWRTLEGLPTRNPYVQEYQGHTSITRPENFGWPELAPPA